MNACHDCQRLKVKADTGRVRYCADGNYRCLAHRADWLEKQGVWKPAKPVPAHVGSQGTLL